jgi:hypothetical protein
MKTFLVCAMRPFLCMAAFDRIAGQWCQFSGSTGGTTDCTFSNVNAVISASSPGTDECNDPSQRCAAKICASFDNFGGSCCAKLVQKCGTTLIEVESCGSTWTRSSIRSCLCSVEPWTIYIQACNDCEGNGCQSSQIGVARIVDCDPC